MPDKIVLAFDVYGTLLTTGSVAEKLSSIYGSDKGSKIAAQWRRYQLEYTWRLNSMNSYLPFHEVTKRALRHAVGEVGAQVSTTHESDLMQQYNRLESFPEVKVGLDMLAKTMSSQKNIESVLFSNGTMKMVDTSMENSPDLGSYAKLFTKTVLIDEMPFGSRAYKPAPATYDFLASEVNTPKDCIWLISSNPFDVVGANAVGIKTAWVDRVGSGWVDALSAGEEPCTPDVIGKGIEDTIAEIIKKSGI